MNVIDQVRARIHPGSPVDEELCTVSSQRVKLSICPLMESPTLVGPCIKQVTRRTAAAESKRIRSRKSK